MTGWEGRRDEGEREEEGFKKGDNTEETEERDLTVPGCRLVSCTS